MRGLFTGLNLPVLMRQVPLWSDGMLRYPDVPCREIDYAHLHDMPGWFAKLKIDGWRCLVRREGKVFSYWSKSLKPLVVHHGIMVAFQDWCGNIKGDFIIDCELTGNRRTHDAVSIVALDVMHGHNGTALDRWVYLGEVLPLHRVPAVLSGFREAYNKGMDNSLAEGIVLFKSDSNYIGSKHACAAHPGIIKCKWRAGQAGTTEKKVLAVDNPAG